MRVRMIHAMLCVLAGLGAIVALAGCSPGGKVVNIEKDSLTFTSMDGSEETLAVDPATEITLDGKPAELEDLESGDTVAVVTEQRDGVDVAKVINARSAEQTAPPAEVTEPGAPPEDPEDAAGPEGTEDAPLPEDADEAPAPQGAEDAPLPEDAEDAAEPDGAEDAPMPDDPKEATGPLDPQPLIQ